ncbi:3-isopropylmalate dehydratase small subunit, partial [Salmonella enterica]
MFGHYFRQGNKMDTFKQISGRIAPMLEPNID